MMALLFPKITMLCFFVLQLWKRSLRQVYLLRDLKNNHYFFLHETKLQIIAYSPLHSQILDSEHSQKSPIRIIRKV